MPQPYPEIYTWLPIRYVVTKRYQGQRVTSFMVTTRYSDQQGSKSRQNVCDSRSNGTDQYQNGLSNLLTPHREQPRSTRIVVAYPATHIICGCPGLFRFLFLGFSPPESLSGDDVLCRLLPRPLPSVCFFFFFFPTVFVPDLFWCNFLYLVTKAEFVADQLIM